MEIEHEIIRQTTLCSKNFGCLKNQTCISNEVESFVNEKVLFLTCTEKGCPYYMSFGYSTICNCPTRKEIVRKYKR